MSLSPEHIELISSAFNPLKLDAEKHASFFNSWEKIDVDRNFYLTEAGAIERYFYVVIEGVQTVYLIDRNGDKKVIGFSFDGSFSGIYDAFLKVKPSDYFLETLTPSKLLRINYEDFNAVFDLYPEFDRWGRIVHLELLTGRVKREVELITKTAEERFEVFMDRCPPQLLQIPQKYLASYLNLTPETFSRMRKKSVQGIS